MWIKLPTPFKRADILVDISEPHWESRKTKDKIVVLHSLDCWDSKEMKENGYFDGKNCGINRNPDEVDFEAIDKLVKGHEEHGDLTDMCYCGYFQFEDDLLYYEVEWNYLDLEYYRKELEEQEGMLMAISKFLKKEIDGELLAKAYHIHNLRKHLNDEMLFLDYLGEYLPLLGLPPRKEK